MKEKMGEIIKDKEYSDWLKSLKNKVRSFQIKAAVKVNTEMINFYWELGADIVEKQSKAKWGEGLLLKLSKDLMSEFPEMKGFSERNLRTIRQWYIFYEGSAELNSESVDLIRQQAVAELKYKCFSLIKTIPWGHNVTIICKCKGKKEALYYTQQTIKNNWSRAVLTHQIENKLYEREGKAITNFAATLPEPQSDLAIQILKDPYVFDFIALTKEHNELELEKELISQVTHFLLELGAGFAYVGRQIPLKVGEREFFIDLLFYHIKLHCFVVIELKTVEFEPEHTGKLNFYIKAVDSQFKQNGDQPTIGILLCKSKDKTVAEYSLSDINKPIGVSEYQLIKSLPDNLKSNLPSIEDLENELSKIG